MTAQIPSTIVETLREAYRLLASPQCFTVSAMALDAHGNVCAPEDARAVAFDVVGALWKILPGSAQRTCRLRNDVWTQLNAIARELGAADTFQLQQRGHAAVLDLLRIAGERAKAQAAAPAPLELTASEGVAS